MIKVAVLGAAGRMGRLVCQTVIDDPDLDLVAAIGGSGAGRSVGELIGRQDVHLAITTGLDALSEADAQVAVDFTRPDAVMANVRRIVPLGVHVVVGTSGLGPDDLDEIRSLVDGGLANAMVVPNFAVGAVLMQRFAAQAARFFRPSRSSSCTTTARQTRRRARPWPPPAGCGRRGGRRGGPHRPRRPSAGFGAETSTACGSIRSGCPAWSGTKRSSWAARARS